MDSPKYAAFDISEITYKTFEGQPIKLYVFTPKKLSPGKHPVLVKFHGGFLVTGAALYPDWFPQWLLDFITLHSAIAVLPEHRLMPESTGLDILEDFSDFWDWVRSGALQSHLDATLPGVHADLAHVAACGESAGGYLSVQSGLSQPKGFIKAVIATYPCLDLESSYYSAAYEKSVLGAPTIPEAVLADHLKAMEPGRIVTSVPPPGRLPIALSFVQQGRFPEFLGSDESLYPLKRMEKVDEVPPMLILHGRDDSAVPVEGSVKFVDMAEKRWGKGKVVLHTEPGEHGFDGPVPLDTPWLKELLPHVTRPWLGETQS